LEFSYSDKEKGDRASPDPPLPPILNCTRTCPENLDQIEAIAEIKKLMLLRR
jgi:hypothetical protein